MASKFLQIASHYIFVEVTGKRVNHGVEMGLKIPVNVFDGNARVIKWKKNCLEKLDNELHPKVKKCVS